VNAPTMNRPIFINYGGGDNSTAVVVEWIRRGLPVPSGVFFADTGGEKPHTYQAVRDVSAWAEERGWPVFQTVRWIRKVGKHAGTFRSLEETSLEREELPSLAYGYKGCSVKWKGQPIDAAVRTHPAYQPGALRIIGYDADEPHRWDRSKNTEEWDWWAPLVDWDMGREECLAAVADTPFAGGVGKSACFFCPASKGPEILALGDRYPHLLKRALELEANAVNRDPEKGLAGRRKWSSIVEQDRRQTKLFEPLEVPCGCYD